MANPDSIKLALAQVNPAVGDLRRNAEMIVAYHAKAAALGADLVIFPELSLVGYPPEDLILMPSLRQEAMRIVHEIAEQTAGGPALLLGSVWEEWGNAYNAALLMDGGAIVHVQPKTMLPNYGVFDEKRIFTAGEGPKMVSWRGINLGILICEDVWNGELADGLAQQGAELLVVINASPFEADKLAHRKEVTLEAVKKTGTPLVYVNTVGGQDDIVFDGGSFVLSSDAKVVRQLPEFAEALEIVAMQKQHKSWRIAASQQSVPMGYEETLWRAMMLGLSDYVGKNGFSSVVLGLSGGIDSALTAAVAADALGAEKVKGVLLPSPYTSQDSIDDALQSAELLGIETLTIPITPGMQMFQEVLSPVFHEANWMENVAVGGNVQARLRGLTLMSISNKFGWMLMSTGNKSELAVGYTTLYGDSCGSYNVLKDLYKIQIYQLAHWRNLQGRAIPERSISKAPSAELAPGQKDEDQLPPYDILDRVLLQHIEGRMSVAEIVAQGFDQTMVERVVRMVRMSEYKRRQSCPGVKLSPMLFGKDRRYPLTNKF